MLRALAAFAPIVAALMILVLLVEPPAFRPADRLPTLRELTAPTVAGLTPEQVQAAIAWGQGTEPEPYVLPRVLLAGESDPGGEAAGVIYTAHLRIAWAAHVRQQSGQPLTVREVPAWMAAPVFYVALRAPPDGVSARRGAPAIAIVPSGTPACCLEPQPTVVRPLWIGDDAAALSRFGAAAPFSDLGVVAAYPMEVLRPELDIVAYFRLDGPDGPTSVEMRGRLDRRDLEDWR